MPPWKSPPQEHWNRRVIYPHPSPTGTMARWIFNQMGEESVYTSTRRKNLRESMTVRATFKRGPIIFGRVSTGIWAWWWKINIRCIFEVFEEGLVLFSFVACFFWLLRNGVVFSLMNVYCEIYYSVDTIDQWVVSKSSCKLILYVRFRIFLRTRHSVILRDIFHIPHVPIFHGFSISKYSSIRETKSKQFNSSLKFKNFLRTIKYGQLIDSQFRKMTRNSF